MADQTVSKINIIRVSIADDIITGVCRGFCQRAGLGKAAGRAFIGVPISSITA